MLAKGKREEQLNLGYRTSLEKNYGVEVWRMERRRRIKPVAWIIVMEERKERGSIELVDAISKC